jgi:hypothetical protein
MITTLITEGDDFRFAVYADDASGVTEAEARQARAGIVMAAQVIHAFDKSPRKTLLFHQ